jgi:hypothetical protein
MRFTIIPKTEYVRKYKFLRGDSNEFLKDCDGQKLLGVVSEKYFVFLWFKFKIK